MIYDMILANVMGTMITLIVTKSDSIMAWILSMISKIHNYYYPPLECAILTVSAVVTTNTWNTHSRPSEEYTAVIHQLHKRHINLHQIRQLPVYGQGDSEHGYYVVYPKPILLDPVDGIWIRSYKISEDIGKGNETCKKLTVNIDLKSDRLKVYQLNQKLKEWILEYRKARKQYQFDGTLFYYSLDSAVYEKEEKTKSRFSKFIYHEHRQCSFKTMDNIFFKDKDTVLARLQEFTNGKDQYARRGIPYNLGFLLYGEPGCGKTSFIKALSAHTERHILDINLRKIKTCGEFYKLFTNEILNNTYIPIDKRIIVLEDIDCMDSIVIDRAGSVSGSGCSEPETELPITAAEHILGLMTSKTKYKADDALNLSCILNCIDGTYEQSGRILIITTNYPEKLDKALIRAGRIDCKVHFTKCTRNMLCDMIDHFYDRPGYTLREQEQEHGKGFAPADVLEYCFNEPDIDKVINYFSLSRTKDKLDWDLISK